MVILGIASNPCLHAAPKPVSYPKVSFSYRLEAAASTSQFQANPSCHVPQQGEPYAIEMRIIEYQCRQMRYTPHIADIFVAGR